MAFQNISLCLTIDIVRKNLKHGRLLNISEWLYELKLTTFKYNYYFINRLFTYCKYSLFNTKSCWSSEWLFSRIITEFVFLIFSERQVMTAFKENFNSCTSDLQIHNHIISNLDLLKVVNCKSQVRPSN